MKKMYCLLFALILTIEVNAQTVKKYSGQMSKPEWIADLFEDNSPDDINGYYSYYEDANEERIIHGEFIISYKTSVSPLSYEIHGSFSHGKRNGKWAMKAKLPNGKYVTDYLHQFEYSEGVLNGPFHFYSTRSYPIGDYEIVGWFVNGVIAGKVAIKQLGYGWDRNYYVQTEGPVNRNGNPHGIWTEKVVYKNAIPKDVTMLYYDGNLVYRRVKDLSSGKIEYTFSISDDIRVPADTIKICDTIIKGKKYIKVGNIVCVNDTNPNSYEIEKDFDDSKNEDNCVLYGFIHKECPMVENVYPAISNWLTRLDKEYYIALARQEEQQRLKEIQQRLKKEEQRLKEEQLRKEKWEKEIEEERIRRAVYNVWDQNRDYYEFCWGESVAWTRFEKLYRTIGLNSINAMLDSISRYEYENYSVEELFYNTPEHDRHYSSWHACRKKKKKLNRVFKTYEDYLQCKKSGIYSFFRKL